MLLIGHRGARNEAPENTLRGFEHIRKLDINCVEFDVRLSKDNELVVIHDDTLERTTNGEGLVKEFSSEELKLVDACSHFSPELPKEGVPTLKEVLEPWGKLVHAQIEVKPPKKQDHKIICEKIREVVEDFGLKEKCVVTSSDIDFLESGKEFLDDFRRGYIFYKIENKPFEVCELTGCSLLAINWKLCFEDLIREAHEKNIEVSAWTVNEEKEFLKLKSWGIDSIITDTPTPFLKLLD